MKTLIFLLALIPISISAQIIETGQCNILKKGKTIDCLARYDTFIIGDSIIMWTCDDFTNIYYISKKSIINKYVLYDTKTMGRKVQFKLNKTTHDITVNNSLLFKKNYY
jgi:hypothetical protein